LIKIGEPEASTSKTSVSSGKSNKEESEKKVALMVKQGNLKKDGSLDQKQKIPAEEEKSESTCLFCNKDHGSTKCRAYPMVNSRKQRLKEMG